MDWARHRCRGFIGNLPDRYEVRILETVGYGVIDAEELWDVARNKVPEFLAVLRPELDRQ